MGDEEVFEDSALRLIAQKIVMKYCSDIRKALLFCWKSIETYQRENAKRGPI